ncbi:MAG TPA: hypothetical protein VKZ18_22755 [Polyangia bacterium]|nr:hypothetical protein [Polyangia bacterium]
MKKLLVGVTVLLVHTAAAHAQQAAPPVGPPDNQPGPPPSAPQQMPPAYAPPPGYVPPAPPAPPPPTYAAPVYGAPAPYTGPTYPPPPPYRPYYRYPAYRYAPPPPYYTVPPPPPRDPLYRPFTLGGGIGFGGLNFVDQYSLQQVRQGGFSYTFRLGFGLRPGLLLLWDVEGAAANYNSSTVSQTANLVALQIFCGQRFFLKGGFGVADAVEDNLPTQWGAAAMGGIGYELVQSWNWSFDIEATITGAHLNNSGSDQTWSNWSLVNFALNFY